MKKEKKMKNNYLKILLIWFGIGIITTTFLQSRYNTDYKDNRKINSIYLSEYWKISAALTIGGALFIIAFGLKRKNLKKKKDEKYPIEEEELYRESVPEEIYKSHSKSKSKNKINENNPINKDNKIMKSTKKRDSDKRDKREDEKQPGVQKNGNRNGEQSPELKEINQKNISYETTKQKY